jgi:hypothetical protein
MRVASEVPNTREKHLMALKDVSQRLERITRGAGSGCCACALVGGHAAALWGGHEATRGCPHDQRRGYPLTA